MDPRGAETRATVEKTVAQLMFLSRSDEACRLLGVDGVLVDQVDITILDDPLDYLSRDIARTLHAAAGDTAPVPTLSALVGELRLAGLIISRIDQFDLIERVVSHLQDMKS